MSSLPHSSKDTSFIALDLVLIFNEANKHRAVPYLRYHRTRSSYSLLHSPQLRSTITLHIVQRSKDPHIAHSANFNLIQYQHHLASPHISFHLNVDFFIQLAPCCACFRVLVHVYHHHHHPLYHHNCVVNIIDASAAHNAPDTSSLSLLQYGFAVSSDLQNWPL